MRIIHSWSRNRLLRVSVFVLAISLISAPIARADSARIIIHRSPALGNRTWLRVWIDDKEFKSVAYNHDFEEPISAGHHVIAVLSTDNQWHFPPSRQDLAAKAGHTYRFTAVWRNDRVVLEGRTE
jgi:hypothetical protein